MVTRRSSPGLGQWLVVTFMIVGVVFLLYQLYLYGSARRFFPAGLEVAGIDIGGYTREEAEQILTDRFRNAPIVIYHREQAVEISPAQAEFELDLNSMMVQAEYQRDAQDFWAGFWGFLWNRPVEVDAVPLIATHNRDALISTLEIIRDQLDSPALPPQPVPSTMSFQYGGAGIQTDIAASLADVEAALYRARDRVAYLVVQAVTSPRPNISLLERLVVNHMREFEDTQGGVASVFIMDLTTGEEIAYNSSVPMSGMSVLKLPVLVQVFNTLTGTLSAEQQAILSAAMTETGNESANQMLRIVAGTDDATLGADLVSDAMRKLGLVNTYLTCPFDDTSRRCRLLDTPANTVAYPRIDPDDARQTTAEDIGTLLAMLYYCDRDGGGALPAAYGGQMTPAKCSQIIDLLALNRIGSLLEEGVPPDTTIAHRHGWQGDTYADAGIVYTAGGDYVIVQFVHKPGYLDWGLSSPLIADISRATYNFFNFDDPYVQ